MLATIQRTVAAGVKHVRPMPFDGVGVRGVLDIALGDMRRQCVCVCLLLGMKWWSAGYWPFKFIFPNMKAFSLKEGRILVVGWKGNSVPRAPHVLLGDSGSYS